MNLQAEPVFLKPIYKETLWGGDALRVRFGRPLPAGARTGESWEVSAVEGDLSAVAQGPFTGMTLERLAAGAPRALLGEDFAAVRFPLLVKIIDAKERLSVQVHPERQAALEHGWGENGKTECWYVIDAEENARVIAGFREEVNCETLGRAIEVDSLEYLLNVIPVKKGDVLYVPAGTVHAIMGGTLLYEVQETSDVTLRLYDWGRRDAQGRSRPLRLREALSVLDTQHHDHGPLEPVVLDEGAYTHAFHSACRHFALERYAFVKDGEAALEPKRSFRVLTVIGGAVRLNYASGSADVPHGTTVLLPACIRDARAAGAAGAEFLLSSVPDLASEIIAPLRKMGVSDDAIRKIGGFPEKNDLAQLLK